jgi:hypothetical protein
MTVAIGPQQSFQNKLVREYLPAFFCFLVINITNSHIPALLASLRPGSGLDAWLAVNYDKNLRYTVIPAKSLIFLVGTAVLFVPLAATVKDAARSFLSRQAIVQTVVSLFCCLLLTATITPLGFGIQYAGVSTDPFNQEVGQFYRRALLPGLANLYHLDGAFYILAFWAVVLIAALFFKAFLASRGFLPTFLHEISLLSAGIFSSSFQAPGYPEVVVLMLALIALMAFERKPVFSPAQMSALILALLAHETCAVIVFAPMILFIFGRKSWLPASIILLIYIFTLAANFSFDIVAPLKIQDAVAGITAQDYFRHSPLRVFFGGVFSFKFLWVLFIIGLYCGVRRKLTDLRWIWFAVSGVLLAAASTYLGTDYSRLVSFATIPVAVSVAWAFNAMPRRAFDAMMAANLLIPSFCFVGTNGLVTFKGLYDLVYAPFFNLPPPL